MEIGSIGFSIHFGTGITGNRSATYRIISNDVEPAPNITAAPSHTTSGPPSIVSASATSARLARCSDSPSSDWNETTEVDDATDADVFGRGGDVAGRRAVGVAEAGLTDGVHQVVDDVDRAGSCQRRARRFGFGSIQLHRRDVVDPPETPEPLGVAGSGKHVMTGREELRNQSRPDITGRAGHKNSHTPNVDIPGALQTR